jgi:AhpD family alkylhydroperoxidase
MATAPLLSDAQVGPEAEAVFADIRDTRGTAFINNFWRALANDPPLLRATWERLKSVMVQSRLGGLDPLVKEMVYLAVSVSNSCNYCAHSHTAAARAKGMTDAQYADLLAVIAMASQTNALATALAVPVDAVFDVQAEGSGSVR